MTLVKHEQIDFLRRKERMVQNVNKNLRSHDKNLVLLEFQLPSTKTIPLHGLCLRNMVIILILILSPKINTHASIILFHFKVGVSSKVLSLLLGERYCGNKKNSPLATITKWGNHFLSYLLDEQGSYECFPWPSWQVNNCVLFQCFLEKLNLVQVIWLQKNMLTDM